MSVEKLSDVRRIAADFQNFDIYASSIVVQHGSGFDPRTSDKIDTFSRYSWTGDSHELFYRSKEDSDVADSYMIRFCLNTLTIIGADGFVPDDEDIPEEKIVGTIAVGFNVEYFVSHDPSKIDADVLSMIERIKVFNDAYPFWREALQSLAMRAKLPVPVLPAQRPDAMMASLAAQLQKPAKARSKRALPKSSKI